MKKTLLLRILRPLSKYGSFIFVLMMLSNFSIFGQSISGTIIDASDKTPIIGATVVEKGSKLGTITDADGRFEMTLSSLDAVILVSYTGYAAQELTGQAFLTGLNVIELSSNNLLIEIVVVGALGIKEDRRKTSYSIQSVSSSQLASSHRDNAFVALQGRVSGLSSITTSGLEGGSTSINLRGVNSIGNSNQPLIVLDGLPINSSTFNTVALYSQGAGLVQNLNNNRDDVGSRLNDLNPNDIESITVLKGPEASALYGNEGANGVIIITSKKGKSGRTEVNYKARFGVSEVTRFPKIQTKYGRGKNGIDNSRETDYFGGVYPANTKIFDNLSEFFEQGNNMRHDLSIDGGTEKLTYRFSNSFVKKNGVVPKNNFTQYNTSLSMDSKILSWLNIQGRFSYTKSNTALPPGGTNGYFVSALSFPSNIDMTEYLNPDGTRKLTSDNNYSTDNTNPYFEANKNVRKEETDRTIANITLNSKLTDWWSIVGQVGVDAFTTNANKFFHPQSGVGFKPGGWIENYTNIGKNYNFNLYNNITKKWNKLSSNLIIGGSAYDRNDQVASQYGEKLYLQEFNSINNTLPTTQRNRAIITRSRLIGAFAKLELNYDNYLIINATGRNDRASTLPKHNNSYFYPSMGLTFAFSDIPALKDKIKGLDFGKLRMSYAKVGNPAPPYKISARLLPQTTNGGGFSYDFYGDNSDLKPEKVTSYEIGTDLQFLKNRLTLDVAYFSKTIEDQIVIQRLSYGTGFIFGLLNGGKINTKGLEIQLGIKPMVSENFNWNILTNFTKYKSKVVSLPANVNEYYDSDTWVTGNARASAFSTSDLLSKRFSSANNRYYPELHDRGAGSATAIGGWSYLRNSKGQVLIDPKTGFPLFNSNFLPIGDRNPDFVIGLTNEFTFFKKLHLSFLLDIRKGGDVFNGNEYYLTTQGLSLRTLDREKERVIAGVLKDGNEESDNPTTNTISVKPIDNDLFYATYTQPEDFVERDINWLRLKDINLSYDFPTSLFSKASFIKGMSAFINATDLFLITNYTGADPNVNATSPATGGSGGYGIDYGKVSTPRTITAGFSLTF